MPVDKREEPTSIDEFDGIQRKTNRFVRSAKNAWDAQNVSYEEIGSIKKTNGYAQRASDLTTTTSTSSSTSTTTTSTSTSSSTSTSTSTSTS